MSGFCSSCFLLPFEMVEDRLVPKIIRCRLFELSVCEEQKHSGESSKASTLYLGRQQMQKMTTCQDRGKDHKSPRLLTVKADSLLKEETRHGYKCPASSKHPQRLVISSKRETLPCEEQGSDRTCRPHSPQSFQQVVHWLHVDVYLPQRQTQETVCYKVQRIHDRQWRVFNPKSNPSSDCSGDSSSEQRKSIIANSNHITFGQIPISKVSFEGTFEDLTISRRRHSNWRLPHCT
mmetsp:Transcript_22009/g.89346  ORF Transcript_22009/g.89346 Transcript_22009/m.89346 type:complete len:234 (-) Transcript_22009:745-1446(-)